MLNRVILIGRLTRDPELKYTPQGTPVVSFSLATNRFFNTPDGNRKEFTDFINCVAWRNQAEFMGRNGSKGRLVFLEGRLENRSWEANDGTKRRVTEVVANSLMFLDRKPGDAVKPVSEMEFGGTSQVKDPFGEEITDDSILDNFLKDEDSGGF